PHASWTTRALGRGEQLMMSSVRSTASRLKQVAIDIRDKQRFGRMYLPDPLNQDVEEHIQAAIQWLKRAQDAGPDRGVSYGAVFGSDFQQSYPETTGYICRTFVDLWDRYRDQDLLVRALDMGNWETEIQLADGAVMGGKFSHN